MIIVHYKTIEPTHPSSFRHLVLPLTREQRNYTTLGGARRGITRRLNDFTDAQVQWKREADDGDYMNWKLEVYKDDANGDPVLQFEGRFSVKIVQIERTLTGPVGATIVNDEYTYTGYRRRR